jgi:hypothetical protein
LTQEITAYLSDDGRIFRNRADAQFADHLGVVGQRIATFLTEPGRVLPPDPAELLLTWEDWRIGGRVGWEETLQALHPAQAALPLEAQPVPSAEVTPPVAPVPARAKPGPKPKNKDRTAISDALEAARVTQQRKDAEARPAAKTPAAYRKHVAVIGLFNIHHEHIQREFGNELKLTIYDADCIAKLHGLRACHKVVVMTKFVSHKHVELLKSIGQEPMLVMGGMDKLKEALTTIYVNS